MTPQDANPVASESGEHAAVLARRSALLKALRAGGVAAAGGVSVNAFASRIVTSNGTQCTVSGQASAMVSKAANDPLTAPCGGFAPTSFFDSDSTYNALSADLYSVSIGAALFEITDTYVAVQTGGTGSTKGTKLTVRANTWPALSKASVLSRARIVDIFGDIDATPLLYALYRNDDLSFYVAAYFSALLAAAPASKTHVPFPASDVQRYFKNGALDPSATQLYRLICVS